MRPLLAPALGAVLLSAAPAPAAGGVDRDIVVAGETRSYRVHVPARRDPGARLPVLFVFHGAGSDAESMVAATGFDAMAEAAPMLVVYPRARAATRRYDVDPPRGAGSADVAFVDALLARLRERFPVDERRIWATGFSNGAALCYRLAAERGEVLAAVAPLGGYVPGTLARLASSPPVPTLHVHGAADRRVRPPDPSDPADRVVAWARGNGATQGPVASREPAAGVRMRRLAWSGATPRSDTQVLLLEGEGHAWPGGPGGPVSRAILAFLAAHPRPEAAPGPPEAGLGERARER